MERRMISASFVEEALDALRRRGLPTGRVLAAAGLSEGVTEPVSAEDYGKMWLALSQELDDEFFGLAARPMRPGGFTLLCHCLLDATRLVQRHVQKTQGAANCGSTAGWRGSNCARAARRARPSPIAPIGSCCMG
jgi:hypothetical protein